MDKLSVIVPCYNEEKSVMLFYIELCKVICRMNHTEFEILFVDDGSSDKTREIIERIAAQDARVFFLSFSRNFGKEAAIYAGLKHVSGSYVVVMDVDLQDPPSLLPEMYQILQTGQYDCVATKRSTRTNEPPVRSMFAHGFYKLFHKCTGLKVADGARDFRMMTRNMADCIAEMPEYGRFSKGIFAWVGFETKWLEFENKKRVAGETKWSFMKLLGYAFEGLTAFSFAPLHLSTLFAVLFFAAFVIFMLFCMFSPTTRPFSALTGLILAVASLQFFVIGILGQYLSKIALENKRRPHYIIKKTNLNNQKQIMPESRCGFR
ncbi:glycosyltransferase family 2 protein [Congzhengia sp.]|uniref:glycosyltransferase family 2 protein n=1 Tax=Congzhengia sp. TaxID=2944168 RepID=UPI003076D817|nr:glycosyltransferase [Clostridiales bacterium]